MVQEGLDGTRDGKHVCPADGVNCRRWLQLWRADPFGGRFEILEFLFMVRLLHSKRYFINLNVFILFLFINTY